MKDDEGEPSNDVYPPSNHGVLETPAFIDDFPSFFFTLHLYVFFFFRNEKKTRLRGAMSYGSISMEVRFRQFWRSMVSGTAIGGTT